VQSRDRPIQNVLAFSRSRDGPRPPAARGLVGFGMLSCGEDCQNRLHDETAAARISLRHFFRCRAISTPAPSCCGGVDNFADDLLDRLTVWAAVLAHGVARVLDETFSAPEILKPIRSQLGVTHRVLDVLVPEPGL
jgi:hypothetical protein